MTCGNLACGRSNYDGTGGNNHGVEHFNQTGHPLVVKTGTITPEGSASIHCYACDDEVVDENLAGHLAVFGLEVATMKKTERTIAEMELERNLNFQLSRAVEEGRVLRPVYGSGFTGLHNLGNSCYMNSIMQILFSLDPWVSKYANLNHLEACGNPDPTTCAMCQINKLGNALMSGEYSVQKWSKPIEVTTEAGDAIAE
jgi:ubiquitin carboxyl-terminal hydrolase 5/13